MAEEDDAASRTGNARQIPGIENEGLFASTEIQPEKNIFMGTNLCRPLCAGHELSNVRVGQRTGKPTWLLITFYLPGVYSSILQRS
jgi:hypothetical protein